MQEHEYFEDIADSLHSNNVPPLRSIARTLHNLERIADSLTAIANALNAGVQGAALFVPPRQSDETNPNNGSKHKER